jgi:hypothetical protein
LQVGEDTSAVLHYTRASEEAEAGAAQCEARLKALTTIIAQARADAVNKVGAETTSAVVIHVWFHPSSFAEIVSLVLLLTWGGRRRPGARCCCLFVLFFCMRCIALTPVAAHRH